MSVPYRMSEEFPCSPSDLAIMPYALPMLLGSAKMEEAAARLLIAVQAKGVWAGIRISELSSTMEKEMAHVRAEQENRNRKQAHDRAMSRYYWLCVLSLGLYVLFGTRPVLERVPVPPSPNIISGIPVFGPRHVAVGLKMLADRGLVQILECDDPANTNTVIFPTPELVQLVYRKFRTRNSA